MPNQLFTNVALLCIVFCTSFCLGATKSSPPRKRSFEFHYGASLVDLKPGSQLRVWIPVPRTTVHQKISWRGFDFSVPVQIAQEPKYGNRILYFSLTVPPSGKVDFAAKYLVNRQEVQRASIRTGKKTLLAKRERRLFLSANRLVPITPLPQLFSATPDLDQASSPKRLGRVLYNLVRDHMRYDKSKPGFGNGDVLWACDSRFGNCTDFHSLFISLARSRQLPARFEIGFPLPEKHGRGAIGGYHCWASFHTANEGWMPVDISEADKHPKLQEYYFGNLTENRVSFTVGRDLTLVPKQAGPPLNYFVYPYAEMNGTPLAKKHISLDVRYQDK